MLIDGGCEIIQNQLPLSVPALGVGGGGPRDDPQTGVPGGAEAWHTARELGTDQGPGQRETTEKSNCNFCDEYQRLESHV